MGSKKWFLNICRIIKDFLLLIALKILLTSIAQNNLLRRVFITSFLLLLIYSPIIAYSQDSDSESGTEMFFSGNTTSVIKDRELPLPPEQFPYYLIFSLMVILGVTISVLLMFHLSGKKFSDIIRDGDYYPSLPRFQFLVWTFVISFVYLSIYAIRISSGEFDAPAVDNNLLILLGVSIISPILGNIVSGYKYTWHVPEKEEEKLDRKPLRTMLLENEKPALFRYQMFLWTFVGVIIFISLFATGIYEYIHRYQQCLEIEECIDIEALAMPKIDNMLVTLMGLSQSGYLGGKIVARTPARINKIYLALNNKLIIVGQNFGTKDEISSGSILINDIVVAGHTENEVKWFDTKIEFPIPEGYRNRSFKLGIIIDDVIHLEHDYVAKAE